MQQLAGAVRARWYAMLLIAFGLGAPIGLAHAQGSSTRADVAEMLKKHDEALNQQNLGGLLALYAPSPKTVMLGTGPGEKFQGKEEIKTAYTEIFKDFDKGTLTHSCYWKDGGGSGTMVWGAAMCKFADAKGEKKREYELNVSMVAEKQGGKWQFVLLHYSNVVGNAPNQ
jgi:ketosteroid isomerase-like protein